MNIAVVALISIGGFATARVARDLAVGERRGVEEIAAPYAPSPASAPIVTLGYREVAADLLFVRLLGYFGGPDNEAHAMANLAEAITTLDPKFRRVYEIGAVATTAAHRGVDNTAHLRAIALLAKAAREFPTYWRYPNLAGQIYLVDLQTDDPAQRRAWDEEGARLLETASRKPNAPAEAGITAASLRTRIGQQQRAIDGLKELLLVTDDARARQRIIAKIAALAGTDADEIAAELIEAREEFEARWRAERPAVSASFYVLIGPPLEASFDLVDLATGGRDLITRESFERLEPLTDPPPPPTPGGPAPALPAPRDPAPAPPTP